MTTPSHQRIIQRPAAATDLEALVSLEDAIRVRLGDSAWVDGHDFGSGEGNIFILTADPVLVSGALRPILMPLSSVRVAYRRLDSDDFTILYPSNLTAFSIS